MTSEEITDFIALKQNQEVIFEINNLLEFNNNISPSEALERAAFMLMRKYPNKLYYRDAVNICLELLADMVG